jgi:hypothetical protein
MQYRQKKIGHGLLILAVFITLTGCSAQTIHTAGSAQAAQAVPAGHQQRIAFYAFGTIGEQHVQLTQYCLQGKTVQVQLQSSVLDVASCIASVGIYCPQTLSVWCAPESSVVARDKS